MTSETLHLEFICLVNYPMTLRRILTLFYFFLDPNFTPEVAVDSESYPAAEGKPLADLKLSRPLKNNLVVYFVECISHAICILLLPCCLFIANFSTTPHS